MAAMPKRRRLPDRWEAPRARAIGRPTPYQAEAQDRRIGLAIAPLRFFVGATFVYAGLDKLLLDPTFLDPSAPTSITAQLHDFARTSPLAPLLATVGEPLAVPIGILIALAEIAIGLGIVGGLLFRLAAWGGFAIAALLWLTASWSVQPYFLGPDLPYAAGFLTLALVGDGGWLTLRGPVGRWAHRQGLLGPGAEGELTAPPLTGSPATPSALDLSRRRLLELGILALAALVLGGLAGLLGLRERDGAAEIARSGLGPTAGLPTAPAPASPATPAAPATTTGSEVIGELASLQRAGSETFTLPATADPGVLVALPGGRVVAFDAVCTHAGCTVEYDPSQVALVCPCHGATFDCRNHGAVLAGPTDVPLQELPIKVDQQSGRITLAG